jgi:hypothetical protein
MATSGTLDDMSRRERWQRVLESEVRRWSALSCEELIARLRDLQAYTIEFDVKTYQVEVELLENTERYVHVSVAVDDGGLPASLSPLSLTFVREKSPQTS